MEASQKIWDQDKERVYLFLDELTASPVGDRLKLKDESKTKESLPALEEPGRDGLYLPS